jgi:hypothetical protein
MPPGKRIAEKLGPGPFVAVSGMFAYEKFTKLTYEEGAGEEGRTLHQLLDNYGAAAGAYTLSHFSSTRAPESTG